MLENNIERELKSAINQNDYDKLIDKYHLNDQLFEQINYYFDDDKKTLSKNKTVLRIRQKNEQYKLTLKSKYQDFGNLEQSIILTNDQAKDCLINGFNLKSFGYDFDIDVENIAILKTIRTSFVYQEGKIFIDKNIYYGNIDYEIEYEINDTVSIEKGTNYFVNFLNENNIQFKKQVSKAKRAIKTAHKYI